MEQVKDLVLKIAQLLVDHPEEVSVNVIEGGSSVMVELTVSKGNIGKVIGKQGRNVVAIRTILNAIAGKTRKRLKLEIVE
jgi:predicted RNA-binding protein YlqC (UPF0109 family)